MRKHNPFRIACCSGCIDYGSHILRLNAFFDPFQNTRIRMFFPQCQDLGPAPGFMYIFDTEYSFNINILDNTCNIFVNRFIGYDYIFNFCIIENVFVIGFADGGINRNLDSSDLEQGHIKKVPLGRIQQDGSYLVSFFNSN